MGTLYEALYANNIASLEQNKELRSVIRNGQEQDAAMRINLTALEDKLEEYESNALIEEANNRRSQELLQEQVKTIEHLKEKLEDYRKDNRGLKRKLCDERDDRSEQKTKRIDYVSSGHFRFEGIDDVFNYEPKYKANLDFLLPCFYMENGTLRDLNRDLDNLFMKNPTMNMMYITNLKKFAVRKHNDLIVCIQSQVVTERGSARFCTMPGCSGKCSFYHNLIDESLSLDSRFLILKDVDHLNRYSDYQSSISKRSYIMTRAAVAAQLDIQNLIRHYLD
jgi:uncharacterized protein YlaI